MLLKVIGLLVADIAAVYVLHLVLHGWVLIVASIGAGLLTGWLILFIKRGQKPGQH